MRGGPIPGGGAVLADEVGDRACDPEHEPKLESFHSGQADPGKPARNDLECDADAHQNEHRLHQELHSSLDTLRYVHVFSLKELSSRLPSKRETAGAGRI